MCTDARETCRYKSTDQRSFGDMREWADILVLKTGTSYELASWGTPSFCSVCTGVLHSRFAWDGRNLFCRYTCRLVSCCERYRGFFLGSDDETCFAFLQVD